MGQGASSLKRVFYKLSSLASCQSPISHKEGVALPCLNRESLVLSFKCLLCAAAPRRGPCPMVGHMLCMCKVSGSIPGVVQGMARRFGCITSQFDSLQWKGSLVAGLESLGAAASQSKAVLSWASQSSLTWYKAASCCHMMCVFLAWALGQHQVILYC